MKTNVLYYGDNLEILKNREYFPDACIDLIYLDPPFNSKKDYNILFKENGGLESEAQIKAFTDSWHWTPKARDAYHDLIINSPTNVGKLINALHDTLGGNDVMAYLVMMTARLLELHRVLKSTGSLYLHCDPTASHYLKLVLDQIFGPANFVNEIAWKRTTAHGDIKQGARHFGRIHDIIFRYSKGKDFKFNPQYSDYSDEYVDTFYRHIEPGTGRRFQAVDLTARKPGGDTLYEWKGKFPYHGRYWAYSKQNMEEFERKGRLFYTSSGMPRLKYYLDEMQGVPLQDIWDDIYHTQGSERLGYETQKPLALLERIINASSNEGDIVLDPFCGCGTAVVAAQKLKRKWIGIDITPLAINLMRVRLRDSFNLDPEVVGEPADLAGAKALAHQQDRYPFQYWAMGKIGARPVGEKKKGADKGIDGIIPFIDNSGDKRKNVIVQVKSGHVGVDVIKVLKTTAANEAMGVLISLEPPTKPMQAEAMEAGYYHSDIWNKDYPKIQILTIEEILQGKQVDMPPQKQTSVAFAKAPKVKMKQGKQLTLEE
ncbi:MAG: DNA methyltransferase [Dehalococcoidales bacterium]